MTKYTPTTSEVVIPGKGRVHRGAIVEGEYEPLVKAGLLVEVPDDSGSRLLTEPAPLPIETVPESKPKDDKKEKEEDVSENKPRLLTEVEPLPTDKVVSEEPKPESKPKRSRRKKSDDEE